MQADENYKDDLDYLAQLGFEKVAITKGDLEELQTKVRRSSFSLKGIYWGLGSLLIGMGIGAALFFGFHKTEGVSIQAAKKTEVGQPETGPSEPGKKSIVLDTVMVIKENFINPSPIHIKPVQAKEQNTLPASEPADMIVSKPVDLSLLSSGNLKEEKLKYMINSPVFYLHDMKISNYTTLYFKKNRFVRFTGLSAVYSSTNEFAPAGSNLKQDAEYYLHEEIAKAMLQFKKGKYDDAINSLKTVSSYNENDVNCDFYLAMCYFYKKNFGKAVEGFDNCISSSNNTFLQEAMYYKALSLYEGDKKEEARSLFRKIADENEFYAEKAKTYLKD